MNVSNLVINLYSEFLDEEYAHSYMDEHLNAHIATQIKVLREQRGWTQEQLAKQVDMRQTRISLLENVNYSSWSINTLRRLARAFDLRLKVSFETFSSGIDEIELFGRSSLRRTSRVEDLMTRRTARASHSSKAVSLTEYKGNESLAPKIATEPERASPYAASKLNISKEPGWLQMKTSLPI